MAEEPRLGPGEIPRRILGHLRGLKPATVEEIAAGCGLSRRQAADGVTQLLARGLLRRHRLAARTYRLTWEGIMAQGTGVTITSGPKGPTGPKRRRADAFRDRAWRALRIRRVATVSELATDAGKGERDPAGAASRYLRELARAGYVLAVPGPVRGRYRLIRDTGPLAPRWSAAAGVLIDDNLAVRKGAGHGRS